MLLDQGLMKIERYIRTQSEMIEKALLAYLPKKSSYSFRLNQAMRYSVFPGGKRIRPIFTLAACEALGGDGRQALPAACALELIHCYSLIHDDLPCMDNDDWRRGKASCHKKYDEATALLAGNGLLTIAFNVLSLISSGNYSASHRKLEVIHLISEAVGAGGMLGGQMEDIQCKNKRMNLETLEAIHAKKTGALIAVSARVGGILGGGNHKQVEALFTYGKMAGALFQIVDDIIDREGYANLLGLKKANEKALNLARAAKRSVEIFHDKADNLRSLIDFIVSKMKSKN